MKNDVNALEQMVTLIEHEPVAATRREMLQAVGATGLGILAAAVLPARAHAQETAQMHIPSGMLIFSGDTSSSQTQGVVAMHGIVSIVILFKDSATPTDFSLVVADSEGTLAEFIHAPFMFTVNPGQTLYHRLFTPRQATMTKNVTFSLYGIPNFQAGTLRVTSR